MSKTTKEQREFVRDSYIESPESIALNLLDDLEAAEAEVQRLREQTQNLPPLPAGWHGPWEADQDGNLWGMRHGRLCDFAIDCGFKNAQFLADVLNVTHPAP